MAISTNLDKLRLIVGDTNSSAVRFSDDELNYFLNERGTNLELAAADAFEALAGKYATAFNFATDGQKFDRAKVSEQCLAMAAYYRSRGDGISTLTPTRVDGFSDDIDNEAVGDTSTNPRRNFYGQPDRIP